MIAETQSHWWSDSDYRWYEEKAVEHLARTIYEPEDKPEFSGLYNAKGEKLFKLKKKNKIGFW